MPSAANFSAFSGREILLSLLYENFDGNRTSVCRKGWPWRREALVPLPRAAMNTQWPYAA